MLCKAQSGWCLFRTSSIWAHMSGKWQSKSSIATQTHVFPQSGTTASPVTTSKNSSPCIPPINPIPPSSRRRLVTLISLEASESPSGSVIDASLSRSSPIVNLWQRGPAWLRTVSGSSAAEPGPAPSSEAIYTAATAGRIAPSGPLQTRLITEVWRPSAPGSMLCKFAECLSRSPWICFGAGPARPDGL